MNIITESVNKVSVAEETVDRIHIGDGIWDQIKMSPKEYPPLTVERLYELVPQCDWPMLDDLVKDRKDLQERIKKFKENAKKSIQDKTLESSAEGSKEC